MPDSYLSASRTVVFLSALVYWGGVFVQTRRIRRRIGRAPNVKPRGAKEKLLWAGWALVVAAWFGLPFAASSSGAFWLRILPSLSGLAGFLIGIALVVSGYAGTLWCYAAMGSAWRMGVSRSEKTALVQGGPYRLARHPIYMFQAMMLAGAAALLPTPSSLIALTVHVACIRVKAADEEKHLKTVHGKDYENYVSRSGKFFPRIFGSGS
jgi:protein-S-isoprenylcysteine O-methyltransferase Ste14